METLNNVLDGFVYALKKSDDFRCARFIHSGRKEYAQKPEEYFLVACSVDTGDLRLHEEKQNTFSGVLEFCIYAPSRTGKRELCEFCEKITRTLTNTENYRLIEEIKLEDADFDKDLVVWRQSVKVKVDLSDTVEWKDSFGISVCGREASGIRCFSVRCEREVHSIKEFLSGDTGNTVVIKEEYTLQVTALGSKDIFADHPKGGINILCEETGEEFVNCSVKNSFFRMTGTLREREYTLSCPAIRKAEWQYGAD